MAWSRCLITFNNEKPHTAVLLDLYTQRAAYPRVVRLYINIFRLGRLRLRIAGQTAIHSKRTKGSGTWMLHANDGTALIPVWWDCSVVTCSMWRAVGRRWPASLCLGDCLPIEQPPHLFILFLVSLRGWL